MLTDRSLTLSRQVRAAGQLLPSETFVKAVDCAQIFSRVQLGHAALPEPSPIVPVPTLESDEAPLATRKLLEFFPRALSFKLLVLLIMTTPSGPSTVAPRSLGGAPTREIGFTVNRPMHFGICGSLNGSVNPVYDLLVGLRERRVRVSIRLANIAVVRTSIPSHVFLAKAHSVGSIRVLCVKFLQENYVHRYSVLRDVLGGEC